MRIRLEATGNSDAIDLIEDPLSKKTHQPRPPQGTFHTQKNVRATSQTLVPSVAKDTRSASLIGGRQAITATATANSKTGWLSTTLLFIRSSFEYALSLPRQGKILLFPTYYWTDLKMQLGNPGEHPLPRSQFGRLYVGLITYRYSNQSRQ